MKLILIILSFSASYCSAQSQPKYYYGQSETGRDSKYLLSAIPMGTTTQTALRKHSDSLKIIFKWVVDQQKTIKILRDSIRLLTAELSVSDTANFLPTDFKVTKLRKHYSEIKAIK